MPKPRPTLFKWICGSRKLDLRAYGDSPTRFSDPAHSACNVLRRAVIRSDPTSAETLLSLKQFVAPESAQAHVGEARMVKNADLYEESTKSRGSVLEVVAKSGGSPKIFGSKRVASS